MSRGISLEGARMMAALGAEAVLVEQLPGSQPDQVTSGELGLVECQPRRMVAERNAVRAPVPPH